MDSRIMHIRTKALGLPTYTWQDDDPERFMPMTEFPDFVTMVTDRPGKPLLHDYQLNVAKHELIQFKHGPRDQLYTTQEAVCIDVLAYYLNNGPNGKPFDPVPWMDDPLPVLYPCAGGWRVIDGHHRLLAGSLLGRIVWCARAVVKPEFAHLEW